MVVATAPHVTAAKPTSDYTRGLKTIPGRSSDEVTQFVDEHMEPLHAVAVGFTTKDSKRQRLLELLGDDAELEFLATIGVQYRRGNSSLMMYLHRYPEVEYEGKWTFVAMKEWLRDVAYPLVNQVRSQFTPPKYLSDNPFGVVLVVSPIGKHSDALVKALEPHARRYRQKLKFTFFSKARGTADLCKRYGVLGLDELLLIERPGEIGVREHTNRPLGPKYRLEGVTPASIDDFFQRYDADKLDHYYMPASLNKEPVLRDGILELSGWDFTSVVHDPAASVLVAFVSQGCAACKDFDKVYSKLARHVEELQNDMPRRYGHLVVARVDQTANEHPEEIPGTPALRYWPQGAQKKSKALFELQNVNVILDFLEERLSDEETCS